MKPGDTFRAQARKGESFETRCQVEGEFVLLHEAEGVMVCGVLGGAVRRLDNGGIFPVGHQTFSFKRDSEGLLRELSEQYPAMKGKGFRGSAGFREMAKLKCDVCGDTGQLQAFQNGRLLTSDCHACGKKTSTKPPQIRDR